MKDYRKDHITFVDLDEVIVYSFAKILVMNNNKIVCALNNKQFNTYELKENEYFDFSEFESSEVFKNSVPIHNNINKILEYLHMGEVAILTARGDFTDKDVLINFLKSYGLPVGHFEDGDIHIIRCATPGLKPHDAKLQKIKKILKNRPDVKSITLIDDSIANLIAVRTLTDVQTEIIHISGEKWVKLQ